MKYLYNGETAFLYPVDDPSVLKVGKTYTKKEERISGWHTEYVLAEVKGKFNSVWFTPVEYRNNFSHEVAEKGHAIFTVNEDGFVCDEGRNFIGTKEQLFNFCSKHGYKVDFALNKVSK